MKRMLVVQPLLLVILLIGACLPVRTNKSAAAPDKVDTGEKEPQGSLDLIQDTIYDDSNWTALGRKTGLYQIGDTTIELGDFRDFRLDEEYSFADSLIYVAKISTGSRHNRAGSRNGDTVVLRGHTLRETERTYLQQKKERQSESFEWYHEKPGFGSTCPPAQCFYYYIAVSNTAQLHTYKDLGEVKQMIPTIKTDPDVLFLLAPGDEIRGKIAKTKYGYLLLSNRIISHCTINYADVLYRVSFDGETAELGSVITMRTGYCY